MDNGESGSGTFTEIGFASIILLSLDGILQAAPLLVGLILAPVWVPGSLNVIAGLLGGSVELSSELEYSLPPSSSEPLYWANS